ncbi:hypothetical protein [Clostridium folliculivorans]|uniref:Uncharacterized protein n=1 Tax=Clostridium folliculivorans TaxID=2886038 RepID=A0A9W5Y0R3_9CLOT|nr:hypothetical protein [Clostridium folliculivorans]GKU24488.1 hypothetical protein CFOLD11_13140 [Clostridium folliculivorans]GKU30586.1 hypothetical protein CFB3_26930 [Clostridium folliculivorans]
MKISKKTEIIKLYEEGLSIEDISSKGFTKKYVKQVLKNSKLLSEAISSALPTEFLEPVTTEEPKIEIAEPPVVEEVPTEIEAPPEESNNSSSLKEVITLLQSLEEASAQVDISLNISVKIDIDNTIKTGESAHRDCITNASEYDKNTASETVKNCSCPTEPDTVCNPLSEENSLLNPVAALRALGEGGLKDKLSSLNPKDLINIIRTYTPDLTGKVYRKRNKNAIIEYIVEKSSSLSKLGQVFREVDKENK